MGASSPMSAAVTRPQPSALVRAPFAPSRGRSRALAAQYPSYYRARRVFASACPSRLASRLQQPDLAAALHGLVARDGIELLVDRGHLGLDRVAGHEELVRDLPEGQVRGQELQDADLRGGQRQPAGQARLAVVTGEPFCQVVVLRAQDAALGEQVIDVLPRLVEAEPGGDGVV